MSGSAIAPYNDPTRNPYKHAMKQGRVVGVQGINNKDLVAKLRKIDAVKLVDSVDDLKVSKVLNETVSYFVIYPMIYYQVLVRRSSDILQTSS